MRKFMILFGFSLLIIGCKKERIVEVEVEKNYNWKSHPDFIYDDVVQMNSHATNENLFFLGYNSFSVISNDYSNNTDVSSGENTLHYLNRYDQPSEEKLPICDDYFVSYNNSGWVSFIPTENPVYGSTSVLVEINEIDSTFSNFDLLRYNYGECIAINNLKQALVPYNSIKDSHVTIKLALIDIKKELLGDTYLDTIRTKIITIPDYPQYNVIALACIDSYFFVTTYSKVYRIDNSGNIVEILDKRLNRIIDFSEKYYGIGDENIYISNDNGLTWEQGYSVQFELRLITFTKIDDRIIGYRYGQLWEFLINDTEITSRELDNDGLEGKSITSVSKFNGKVYLSTMSGVFYKSIDKFFNSKTEL